jgi:hypothetical protein
LISNLNKRQQDLREVVKRAPRGQVSLVNMSNGHTIFTSAISVSEWALKAPKGSPLYRSLTQELGHAPTPDDRIAIEVRVTRQLRDALAPGGAAQRDFTAAHDALAQDVADARTRGVMVFKAAGNDRLDVLEPGDAKAIELGSGMIVVGAIDLGKKIFDSRDDTVAAFSVEGAKLGAVGVRVPIKGADEDGTSFSTPFTVSVAALMIKANPRLTADQLEQALNDTSFPVKGGLNEVDVVKAVARAKALARSISSSPP